MNAFVYRYSDFLYRYANSSWDRSLIDIVCPYYLKPLSSRELNAIEPLGLILSAPDWLTIFVLAMPIYFFLRNKYR